MKSIGIKLADGSFYPIMEEGTPVEKQINLTTVKDNQTEIHVDIYRSDSGSIEDAEYVDTLHIENINKHPNGEPNLSLSLSLDENNELSAKLSDPESGIENSALCTLSSTLTNIKVPDFSDVTLSSITDDFDLENSLNSEPQFDDFPESAGFDPNDLEFDSMIEENQPSEPSEDLPEEIEIPVDNETSSELASIPLEYSPDEEAMKAKEEQNAEFDALIDNAVEDSTLTADSDELNLPDIDLPTDNLTFNDNATEFEVPSFDDTSIMSDEIIEEDKSVSDSTFIDSSQDTVFSDSDLTQTDFSFDETISEQTDSENTEISDTDFSLDSTDDMFNTTDTQITNQSDNFAQTGASALDFSDILDEETKEGNAAGYETKEDIKKKTRIPVIICIICAIICIIGAALVLFVIPSKLNLIKSRNTKNTEISQSAKQDTSEPKTEEIVDKHPAKTEEIVVAPPQEIIPATVTNTKASDTTYKIKWGDTLWDISDTYYKNPWKYKKIASYNKIQNPDKIISGTTIVIPAE